MTLRVSGFLLGMLCAAQLGTAFAVDCRMDRMIVTMQNTTAMDKYNSAWKEFNAKFAKDEPALRRHAATLFSTWKPVSEKWPRAFYNAGKKRETEKYDTNPANYFSRVAEEELSRKFPKAGVTVKPIIADQALSLNADGEPLFEICIDDLHPIPEGISFACGTVSPSAIPDQQVFADGYIRTIKSSRAINGNPDLQKPHMVAYSADCPNPDKKGQGKDMASGSDSGDATAPKTGTGTGDTGSGSDTKPARVVHDAN